MTESGTAVSRGLSSVLKHPSHFLHLSALLSTLLDPFSVSSPEKRAFLSQWFQSKPWNWVSVVRNDLAWVTCLQPIIMDWSMWLAKPCVLSTPSWNHPTQTTFENWEGSSQENAGARPGKRESRLNKPGQQCLLYYFIKWVVYEYLNKKVGLWIFK